MGDRCLIQNLDMCPGRCNGSNDVQSFSSPFLTQLLASQRRLRAQGHQKCVTKTMNHPVNLVGKVVLVYLYRTGQRKKLGLKQTMQNGLSSRPLPPIGGLTQQVRPGTY